MTTFPAMLLGTFSTSIGCNPGFLLRGIGEKAKKALGVVVFLCV